MDSKLFYFCGPFFIFLTVICLTESGIAESEPVNDTYQLLEDSILKTGSGPLVELNFDSEIVSGFIEDDWAILDRIENQNG